MKKFLILAIIIVFTMSLLFTGVGCEKETPSAEEESEEVTPAEEEEAAPAEEETVEMAKIQLAISPREIGKVLPFLIDDFQEKNPNIEVEWLKVPGVPDEQHTMYVTSLTAQAQQPDVIAVDVVWPGEFIANGWAYPLNDYFTAEEFEPYLDGMMNSVTVDGNVYGVPLYTNAIHFFYRKDLLEKYNVEVPKTWEDMSAAANLILAEENDPELNGYISMWAEIEGLFMNYLQFFWGAGGEFFDEQGNVTVNTAAGEKALQTMVDYIYTEKIAPESILTYKPNDAMTLFRQGRAIFMVVQDYVWPMLNEDDSPVKDQVMMTRVPYFEGYDDASTVCMGGWILILNPYSENKEAAVKLIKHLTTYKAGLEMGVVTGCMPAIEGIENDEVLLENYPIAKTLYEDFMVGNVRPSAQAGLEYPELSHIMQLEIHAALTNQKSVEQALTDAQTSIEEILGK
ncbi:MAG: ABC transporter substrate-binding protein [Actinomycetota bacterium]